MALTPQQREALVELYARGPERVREALSKVPSEALQWKPAPDRWSVHEVVVHCADSESNAALRLRYLLAEKEPLIVGYDQDAWGKTLDYAGHPWQPALALMDASRASRPRRPRSSR